MTGYVVLSKFEEKVLRRAQQKAAAAENEAVGFVFKLAAVHVGTGHRNYTWRAVRRLVDLGFAEQAEIGGKARHGFYRLIGPGLPSAKAVQP